MTHLIRWLAQIANASSWSFRFLLLQDDPVQAWKGAGVVSA
jgi:hypothetical protein